MQSDGSSFGGNPPLIHTFEGGGLGPSAPINGKQPQLDKGESLKARESFGEGTAESKSFGTAKRKNKEIGTAGDDG